MAATLWKGHLTFGLVSVPIRLLRAARAEKVHMHNLQRDSGRRIKQVFVSQEPEPLREDSGYESDAAEPEDPEEEEAVPVRKGIASAAVPERVNTPAPSAPAAERVVRPSELVRGFEYEKGKYVEFEKAELESIAPRNSSEMQIVEFVSFAEIDPVYLETSYYVAADKGGEKPYALLFEALRKSGQSAVAEFVMYRRDQIMILRAGPHGMIGHTLFHEDELKRENEFQADTSLVVPKEMDLATKLIDALAATFEPQKFKDKYRERLQQAISEKIETGAVQESGPETRQAPVIDIMSALKASLMKAKKPAASEAKTTAPARSAGKKRVANS